MHERTTSSGRANEQWCECCEASARELAAERETLRETERLWAELSFLLHEIAIAPVEHDAGGYLVVQIPTPVMLQIRACDEEGK